MVNRLQGKPDADVSATLITSDVSATKFEEKLRQDAHAAPCEQTPSPRKRATKDRK